MSWMQPHLLLETAQTKDTVNSTSVNNIIQARLLSVRSQEAQAQELANQDYAQVYIQHDGSSLSFCVCDGVGSSYKGDFAAQYLAKRLVQWMQALTNLHVQTSNIANRLDDQLNLWACTAQEQLQQMEIPCNTPALVREVLTELRDTYGSETVFLCGRIDLDTRAASSNTEQVNGSYPSHLLVCWMGNVTAQLSTRSNTLATTKQHITLGGDDDRTARWSTLRGTRGPITIWHRHLPTIERLIIHTDGFRNTVAPSLYDLNDKAWQAQMQQLLHQPGNDDVTVLELRWQRR